MYEGDQVYFARRASEERTASLKAQDANARRAHIELAERYEDLVRAMAEPTRSLNRDSASPPPAFGELG
jgi:hypothetical protein